MSVHIKVCGLKEAEHIRELEGLAISQVGFVLAPSRRQVTPQQAGVLAGAVGLLRNDKGQRIETVGVVVNASLAELSAIIDAAPLDVLQLHGAESPQLCRQVREQLGVKVWKVFSLAAGAANIEAEEPQRLLQPYAGTIDGVVIDTAGGGTGQVFDWHSIPAYKAACRQLGLPLYVAGGLHAGNVGELLAYEPDGVDVSSGVETNGMKDIEKIRGFVERVIRQ